jgi:DNA-binding transcriptional LysR family regulator
LIILLRKADKSMDKLKAMSVFVAIVDQGGLSKAAEQIGRSPAAVVRTLAELEAHLGVRLLNRSTRRISLTDDGREYLLHCRKIVADVEAAELSIDLRRETISGKLTLTAPVTFGRLHLAPLINAYLSQHPQVNIELILLDRVVDIIEEGFDLALRIGHLSDSSLVAKRAGQVSGVVLASPYALKRFGPLEHPSDLSHWPTINETAFGREWLFFESGKTTVQVHNPRLTTNQIDVALNAAKEGLGAVKLLSYQAFEAIQSGQLVRVLSDFEQPPVPVQFVYPHSRLLSPRVRNFLNWVVPKLEAALLDMDSELSAGCLKNG